MRCIVMAVIFTVAVPVLARADAALEKVSFQPQVKGLRCLKAETVTMIRELVEKIGPIQITSTCGGRHARNSQHYRGNAIDFRPLATTPRKAAAVAKTLEAVGGVGSYANGLVHVDVGDREFAWFGTKRGNRRLAYNARGR
ncbi:MAG: hypothetical protein C0447_11410 [Methylobacterium sp.]|jgi:uncharacterized protein YcbK (DUF882 family)|nr:hypothetical protein [Methylobacterium sp.]